MALFPQHFIEDLKRHADIVVASAKAYLSALNKLHSKVERVAAQGGGNV